MPRHPWPEPGHRLLNLLVMAALSFTLGGLPQDVRGQAKPEPSTLKIGIIGAGNIGGAVGALWVKAGHQVLFSSRNPENLKPLADRLGPLARAGTVREALAFADAVFIAVPYGAYPQIGKDYEPELAGKIVLDAGNAVLARDGEISKEVREIGIGATSTKYLPQAQHRPRFQHARFSDRHGNRPSPRRAYGDSDSR